IGVRINSVPAKLKRNWGPRQFATSRAGRALDKVVAQVSNLLYRRFPIGRTLPWTLRRVYRGARRLEALRCSRLETCATPNLPDLSIALRAVAQSQKCLSNQPIPRQHPRSLLRTDT